MVEIAGLFGQTGQILISYGRIIGIVLVILFMGGIGVYVFFQQRYWNIKVIFSMPRAKATTTYCEVGKGRYNASSGICTIKREGVLGRKYQIRNFDPKVYLQVGKKKDVLQVIQIGTDEFSPIIPDSYFEVVDEDTGKKAHILSIQSSLTKDLAWAIDRKMSLIEAYTLKDFLRQNAMLFGFGFMMICIFAGFAILWTKIPAT